MLLIICAFIAIFSTFLWVRSRRPANFPPGPTPFPVIGNLHNLAEESNILEVIRKLRKQYGDVFCLSIGKNWVVVVNGRTNLKELLVKKGDLTSDRPYSIFIELLKQKGIISASGSIWKHNRTFSMTTLRRFWFGKRSFEANIMEEVNEFLIYVDRKAGCPFQLNEILHTSVVNAFMGIITGKRCEYNDNKLKHFVNIIHNISCNPTVTGPVNFIPWLAELPFDPFEFVKLRNMLKEIFEYWKSIIREHKNNLDNENLGSFIDIYLYEMAQAKNSNQLAEDQLLCIISDIFIAGTDTIATVIKWFILYMLNHPDVQYKMQAEIDRTIGNGRPPVLSDKPNLPYCQAVMYETLRLSNIGPIAILRLVTGDIEHNGYVIPNGCILMPCLDSVAFDEKAFPDSNVFKPDRFLEKDGQFNVKNSRNVLTFSLGRRGCMGEALAKMELFLYMTSLVQRFTFLPPDNEPIPSMDPLFGFIQSPKPFCVRAFSRS